MNVVIGGILQRGLQFFWEVNTVFRRYPFSPQLKRSGKHPCWPGSLEFFGQTKWETASNPHLDLGSLFKNSIVYPSTLQPEKPLNCAKHGRCVPVAGASVSRQGPTVQGVVERGNEHAQI